MAIVRHKRTSILYEYLGGNKFRNLVTLDVGTVDDEKAREMFVINLEATELCKEYPVIKELIHKIKLKLE